MKKLPTTGERTTWKNYTWIIHGEVSLGSQWKGHRGSMEF